ncbi:MAG TPA: DUF2341 domain-containing protein [Terriglobales bacterium]|nr:DUF2341 domain-containing protein [Terriglobales bacterium]
MLFRQIAKVSFVLLAGIFLVGCGGGTQISPPPVSPACDPTTAPAIVAVTVQNTSADNLSDFPVSIALDKKHFDFSTTDVTGSNLATWDSITGLALPHWVESFDPSAGKGLLWTRLPSLASSGSTTVWLTAGTIPHCQAQPNDGHAVFPFFSDVHDANRWTTSNHLVVSDQISPSPLRITSRQVIQSDGT